MILAAYMYSLILFEIFSFFKSIIFQAEAILLMLPGNIKFYDILI